MRVRAAMMGLASLTLTIAAAGAAQASVTFTDGTFDLSGYSEAPRRLTGAGTSVSVTQCAACGSPGEALNLQFSFPSGGGVSLGFVNNAFTYDPATQGAILGLTASVQKNVVTSIGGVQGNTFRPLIFQNGEYYIGLVSSQFVGPGTTGYLDFSGSFTASGFTRYNYATGAFVVGTPDFTAGVMQFGLAQLSSIPAAGVTPVNQYDNLRFEITSVAPGGAVPEPATWAMMITGFGAAGAVLRRRRALA